LVSAEKVELEQRGTRAARVRVGVGAMLDGGVVQVVAFVENAVAQKVDEGFAAVDGVAGGGVDELAGDRGFTGIR
jgi:hypothetical protein